ncbi:MAG: hypothetical protein OHK0029_14030 [Armatimonadaceae bacterium]
MKNRIPERVFCLAACTLFLLLALTGCSSDKVSPEEEASMRDALEGKNVGEMPPEVKAKMEAAMRKNMGGVPNRQSPPEAPAKEP